MLRESHHTSICFSLRGHPAVDLEFLKWELNQENASLAKQNLQTHLLTESWSYKDFNSRGEDLFLCKVDVNGSKLWFLEILLLICVYHLLLEFFLLWKW